MNPTAIDIRTFFSPKQIAGYFCACLLPLATAALGIKMLLSGMIFNVTFLIAFFLLPCAAFAWNFALVRSKMSAAAKIGLIVILSIVFVFAFFIATFFGPLESLDHYRVDSSSDAPYTTSLDRFPSLSERSEPCEPEEIEYYGYHAFHFIFSWRSNMIICRYSETDYAAEKARIDDTYVFQQTPILRDEYICEPSTQLDGFTFRMRSFETGSPSLDYPHHIVLIGTNDDTHEIVYIYFHDPDRDYITSLNEFINDSCGWKYIR